MAFFIIGMLIAVQMNIESTKGKYYFRVYDPEGKQALNSTNSETVKEELKDVPSTTKVSMVTLKEGNYQFCFQSLESFPVSIKFDYRTGVEANDYSSLTSKEDFQPIQLQVTRLEDMLDNIGKEKRMLTRKSKYFSRNTDEIGFKLVAFSIITLLLMGVLTSFQIVYLKSFFKSKKLI